MAKEITRKFSQLEHLPCACHHYRCVYIVNINEDHPNENMKGHLFRFCYSKGVSHCQQADGWECFVVKIGKASSVVSLGTVGTGKVLVG